MWGQSEVVLPELLLSEVGKDIDLHGIGSIFFLIVVLNPSLVVQKNISPECFLFWSVNLPVVGLELLKPLLSVLFVGLEQDQQSDP